MHGLAVLTAWIPPFAGIGNDSSWKERKIMIKVPESVLLF